MQDKKKKVFISDWELRRLSASGGKPVLPENAIVSPLSSEWLDYGGDDKRVGGLEGWKVGNSGEQHKHRENDLREQIVETGRRLHALGFVPASDGNISVRLCGGTVLITPSGVSKGRLTPDAISKIDMAGELISGKKPSSEYMLHLCVYNARPDVMAVVHAHPPVATGLASAGVALDKPLTSEMVITLGKVPLAAYATPGTEEVSASIAGLVRDHNAIMLANHGVVTCGADLETAFQRMETVEQAAKITLVAEHLGGGKLIPPEKVKQLEEIRRLLGL